MIWVHRFAQKVVVVVAEKTPVKVDTGVGGGEAAGELGPGGGVAEEAVKVGKVLVALG